MSLFKLREFWTTCCEDEEEFDQNSMVVSVLNSSDDFIITGSQAGVLRVFKPSCGLNETANLTGFVPNDLLIEKNVGMPILQVGYGKFASGSQSVNIAVLQPRTVSIYSLKTTEGLTEHGNQNHLDLLYEHHLRRSAASFVIGPFGGVQHRDFICVQSLDGLISVFEQESPAFSCFLPQFLVPGPLVYDRKSDSFVTVNGNWTVVAYKYNQLSEYGEKSVDRVTTTGKVPADWSYNLGEMVIEMSVVEDVISKESWIVVLGERNLFCLNERGKLKFMKRLEYSPICFHAYLLDNSVVTLMVSETCTLLIYENTTLKWSAKLHFLPICVKRIFLENVKGALVLLSDEGRLECGYLGSEPSLFVAPPLVQKDLDFEKIEEELENLNSVIRGFYSNDAKLTVASVEKELSCTLTMSDKLEPCTYRTNVPDPKMCTLTIDLSPQVPFEEVQVTLTIPHPLKITPHVHFFANPNEKSTVTSHVYVEEEMEVPSLEVEVAITLVTGSGAPRCMSKDLRVPLELVTGLCQAQKDAEHKITLNINENPVPLSALFIDFAENPLLMQSSNTLGLKYHSNVGETVTILLAKNSKRYRIQSDSLASLNLITNEMTYRLKRHYSTTDGFKVFYNSSLPSESTLPYVNRHFQARKDAMKLQDDLMLLCAQFRIIQKRLIAKLKAKDPAPLTSLEFLMNDTYTDIISTTEQLETSLSSLTKAQNEMSCVLRLLVNLMMLMDIDKATKEVLASVFSSEVYDVDSQSWEDVFNTSLCFLLRTSLAKSEKDKLRIAPTSFEEVKDISKLEKHLVQVLDRISKKEKDESDDIEEEPEEDRAEDEKQDEEKPIGSQFGEASTRLLSARKSLLRRRPNVENFSK